MKQFFLMGFIFLLFIITTSQGYAENNSNQSSISNIEIQSLRQETKTILGDSKFNYPDYMGWFTQSLEKVIKWFQRLMAKIYHWFKRLLPKQFLAQDQLLTNVLKFIGITCLALLPFGLIYYLPKLFLGSVALKQKSLRDLTSRTRPDQLKEKAAALAIKGDYREAIRYVYLANLEHLKMNGFLPDGIRLTDRANLDILQRLLGMDHPGFQSFFQLVSVFQEKWYGLRNCQSEDYDLAVNYMNTVCENTGKLNV